MEKYEGPTVGPAGDEYIDNAWRRRELHVEIAKGSGEAAAQAAARDRSQAGIRHERRHVRAKKG